MNYECKENDLLDYKIRTLEFKINRLQTKSDDPVVVTTQNGKIKGARRKTIYNDSYCSFERIPYAQKPVGEFRFRAPKPVASWKNIKDCTNYADRPKQQHLGNVIVGSEDCLYLNVYTNNLTALKARPVMVWLYGGGLLFGEANPEWYGPDYFMKKDVVLVTVQYRVGALGFLSLSDPHLHTPGNAGLKDQILALKWIKRNCGAFGGNPECITVFGESAGGFSTMVLQMIPHTKGLFHRAIAQSGVANADWVAADATKQAYVLAQKAGYTGENKDKEVLKYLMKCSADDIVIAERDMSHMDLSNSKDTFSTFGLCIEPFITTHTAVDRPLTEMAIQAWGNQIPLMLGATSNEMLFILPMAVKMPDLAESTMKTCISYLPKTTYVDANSEEAKEKGMRLRHIHVKGETPTDQDMYEILSFSHFWHAIHKTIRVRLDCAGSKQAVPTYLYRFDFDSPKMEHPFRLMRWGRGVSGVAHTDELAYLFSNVLSRRMDRHSRERRTIDRMISLWTSFAETGNPNATKTSAMREVKWRPIGRRDSTFKCLNIGDQLEFIDLPEMEKLRVWWSLYDLHRELPKQNGEPIDLSVYAKSSL